MASKRHLDSGGSESDEPKAKRSATICPPVSFGSIASQEELDMKTLQFQNKKLCERIEVRKQEEAELLEQIETMRAKRTAADATLSLVNRYWDQLDENIKVMLQRLGHHEDVADQENNTPDEDDYKKKSFRRLFDDKEFQDIKENVGGRLEFSRHAFATVVDALLDAKHDMAAILRGVQNAESCEETTKGLVRRLQKENENLNNLTTNIQAEHHKWSLERSTHEQKVEELEDRIEELQETAETARWELKKAKLREDRLTNRLADVADKVSKGAVGVDGSQPSSSASDNSHKNGDKKAGNEETAALSESRLAELNQMKTKHQEALKELEKLKADLRNIPESLIVNSYEYKTLKSQFSVLYHEGAQMKGLLDDARSLLQQTRSANMRRMEQMECDELQGQRKLRNELIQLEDTLAKVRHDNEALHAEFEQNLAANEQAGPVNREMRHLINSLQNHNRQLKGEIQRYKKKIKDLQTDLNKKEDSIRQSQERLSQQYQESSEVKAEDPNTFEDVLDVKHEVKVEPGREFPAASDEVLLGKLKEKDEELSDLKSRLKSEEGRTKELKLLLDMYKSLSKEQRDKAEIMASERDARNATDALNDRIYKLQDRLDAAEIRLQEAQRRISAQQQEQDVLLRRLEEERMKVERFESKPKGPDAETARKMKVLEESISELRRNLAATKQEEEALLSEMDVTGQAFEDMQEQNMRLLQQLREKDDANFKLMSERIKSNQIQKLLQEEKQVLQDQTSSLYLQVESQNQVVRRLEEKERSLHNSLVAMEKEINLRAQAMELHKRKAVEMAQFAEDSKRELDKQKARVAILEESVDRKVESLEEEHFKISRLQEDGARLRRKLEKHKKTVGLYSADEVLMEEIKEYKTKLRCPCCNVNSKDAVLTKCYHVFCIKCIKTRYETRQRKCPKCNAGFGGNDFHRIYIE